MLNISFLSSWGCLSYLSNHIKILIHIGLNLNPTKIMGFSGNLAVKNPPVGVGDPGSIDEFGRSPEEGNGNPLCYSCLGNPMDRGARQAKCHGIAKEWNMTKWLSNNLFSEVNQFSKERRATHVHQCSGKKLNTCVWSSQRKSKNKPLCWVINALTKVKVLVMSGSLWPHGL